ncbi:hypothetical protein CHCC20335_3616 [Bacillus paralicheniformis]|nr:hypothetical protein CHCC20335_3616 [Bacillus paralicheniformis]
MKSHIKHFKAMIPYSSRFKQNDPNKYSCFSFFTHILSYISSFLPFFFPK